MIQNSTALFSQKNISYPMSKVIGIEGGPGGGKTTVLSTIAEQLEGRAILLSEINFEPGSPWKNLPLKDQGDIYLRLWIERMTLLKTVQDPHICFMLDRTYFSNFAYTYALDALTGSHYYPAQVKLFINNILKIPFEKILIFDVSPEIGLQRRQLREDKIPWPWSQLDFLKALQQFYRKELPQFGITNVCFIDTLREKESVVATVKREILNVIDEREKNLVSYTLPHETQIKVLYSFAKKNELGDSCTHVINVLGAPTLYFLKHSLQLNQEHPVFFNNNQLRCLITRYNQMACSLKGSA
ncbi:MAG: hypothetical protein A2W77_05195 [Nitrospinae bacterium RIFCSPLOWO2_12_39_16]|nr:MAG: hypothetical protein A2W77_05195 [Nitrospinae bacterium RIFCSPLOWO2_12_39_16]